MENFFPQIQVKTKKLLQRSSSAQMHTRVKLLGGCSQIIEEDISPHPPPPPPPGFGTPACDGKYLFCFCSFNNPHTFYVAKLVVEYT